MQMPDMDSSPGTRHPPLCPPRALPIIMLTSLGRRELNDDGRSSPRFHQRSKPRPCSTPVTSFWTDHACLARERCVAPVHAPLARPALAHPAGGRYATTRAGITPPARLATRPMWCQRPRAVARSSGSGTCGAPGCPMPELVAWRRRASFGVNCRNRSSHG